jgi:hypothetical protein
MEGGTVTEEGRNGGREEGKKAMEEGRAEGWNVTEEGRKEGRKEGK